MTMHLLPVRNVGSFPVEYTRPNPETGALTVLIWRDESRDDGFMFDVADWHEGQAVLRHLKAEWEGSA